MDCVVSYRMGWVDGASVRCLAWRLERQWRILELERRRSVISLEEQEIYQAHSHPSPFPSSSLNLKLQSTQDMNKLIDTSLSSIDSIVDIEA